MPLLVRAVSRKLSADYPEFGNFSSLTPEQAQVAKAAFIKMLEEAAMGLNETERDAVAAAVRKAENDPIPGAMTEPPAAYRLNKDAAVLLGMTTAESDAIDQVTRETIETLS